MGDWRTVGVLDLDAGTWHVAARSEFLQGLVNWVARPEHRRGGGSS